MYVLLGIIRDWTRVWAAKLGDQVREPDRGEIGDV
jgi:hypothetical protein